MLVGLGSECFQTFPLDPILTTVFQAHICTHIPMKGRQVCRPAISVHTPVRSLDTCMSIYDRSTRGYAYQGLRYSGTHVHTMYTCTHTYTCLPCETHGGTAWNHIIKTHLDPMVHTEHKHTLANPHNTHTYIRYIQHTNTCVDLHNTQTHTTQRGHITYTCVHI